MRVQRELSEADWEEFHRGRRWVTANDAKVLLFQRSLAPMIDELITRVLA